jgi:CheY-like chemotaxis protein
MLFMPTSVSHSTSILLIEPNKTLALKLRDLLAASFPVIPDATMVYSLQEGLKVLNGREISVVLLDLELPDSTGADAVRMLRTATPRNAVIAFTQSGRLEPLLEAVQAGAHELLLNILPSPHELTLAIQTALIRVCPPKTPTEALPSLSSLTSLPAALPKLAHDLNNVLTAINGFSDILLARLQAEEASHRCAEQIKDACDRATGLARDLARLSGPAQS